MFECLPCDLERVRFRHLRRSDLDDFLAYRTDPIVAELQGWEPMSDPEAEAFLAAHATHAALVPGAWQQLGIADRKGDALIGDIGLCLSPDESTIEFGISLRADMQGRGHGSECVRGLIPLLFLTTSVEEVVAHTDVRNAACIATLKRAGMLQVSQRQAVYDGERCIELGFSAKRKRCHAARGVKA